MGPESFPKHFPSELHTNLANFLLAVYHQNVSQFLPSLPAPNYTRFLHTPYSSMSPSKRLPLLAHSKRLPLLAHSIFYWKFYCLTSSRIYVFFLYPCSLNLSSGPHPLFSGQVSGVPEPLAPVIHPNSACTQSHPPTIPDMTFPSSVHTDHISGPSIYSFLHLLLPIFFKYWEVVFFFSYLRSNLGVVLVPEQWIGSMATEWERLKIPFKKLEIPREHFIQR